MAELEIEMADDGTLLARPIASPPQQNSSHNPPEGMVRTEGQHVVEDYDMLKAQVVSDAVGMAVGPSEAVAAAKVWLEHGSRKHNTAHA